MKTKIELIQQTAFNFFMDITNFDEESKGYGLTPDHSNNKEVASIAATGFTLSSYIIADKYGYMDREMIVTRIVKTLKTLYYNVDNFEGFFAHFIDINTGKRVRKSEFSTIDTALAINGVISVSSYFKKEEIQKYANLIINRINWPKFIHLRNNKKSLYMAYNDLSDGQYTNGTAGFIHHWSMFAEQIMMYVFIGADDKFSEEDVLDIYESFDRNLGSYKDIEYYYSPGNTLFIYQYPLCWLDLKNYYDVDNINWFINAKKAIESQYLWARDQKEFKTYGKNLFGITASDTPKGYSVYSALPNVKNEVFTDGTVAPNAIIGSLIFNEKISIKGLHDLFLIDGLWNEKYGFYDAFNFENQKWISNRFISIDKGLEMLMANAYLSKDVQKAYMSHPIIIKGIGRLKWTKK